MSDTLFGRERSGTPIETRGATEALGSSLESFFSGGGENPLDRIGRGSVESLFGFDPRGIGLEGAARGVLRDPADRTRGLFAALEPFEREETARQTAGLRSGFGTLGGRFGSNATRAETNLRGRLGDEFRRSREESLLQANQQRIAALSALLSGLGGTAAGSNAAMSQFLNPGAPNWQEGIFGDILTAAATAAAATGGD